MKDAEIDEGCGNLSIESRDLPCFHSAKRCEAGVLMQQFDVGESGLTQQIQLESDRPRRIFAINVSVNLVAIIRATERISAAIDLTLP